MKIKNIAILLCMTFALQNIIFGTVADQKNQKVRIIHSLKDLCIKKSYNEKIVNTSQYEIKINSDLKEYVNNFFLPDGKIILNNHKDFVYSVGFSPCGRYIVSGSDDKTVRVWDLWYFEHLKNNV